MPHLFRLVSKRTSIQLGKTKGAETVDIPMTSKLSWLILYLQASSNNHLPSNIRHI